MAITFNHNDQVYVKDGNLGVGTDAPGAKMHIKIGNSGATPISQQHLILEHNSATGLGILTTSATSGYIFFGDESDAQRGYISYNHPTDNMTFKVAGAERMRITNDGKVGVGTSAPATAMHIYDVAGSADLKLQRVTGYPSHMHFGFPSGLPTIRTSGNFAIKASDVWGADFYINSSGNVGIGTDSPSTKLHVVGASDIVSYSNGTTTGYLLSDANGVGLFNGAAGSGTGIYARTANVLDFYYNSSIGIRLSSTGNVGIGTTNPGAKLDVNGQVSLDSDLFVGADNGANYTASRIRMYSHNNYRGAGMHLTGVDSNWFVGTPYTDFSGSFVIARKNVETTEEDTAQLSNALLTLRSSGNLGIGTYNPSSRVEISGTTGSYNSGIGFTPTGTGARNYRTYIGTNGFFYFDDATDSSTRITITDSGNVGIGTTTISGQEGAANGTPKLQVLKTGTTGSYDLVARFGTDQDENNSGASVLINAGNDRGLLVSAGRADSNRAIAHLNLIQYDGNELTDGLTIYQPNAGSSGATSGTNVGIGTTAPGYKLDVAGDIKASNSYRFAGSLFKSQNFIELAYNRNVIFLGRTSFPNSVADQAVNIELPNGQIQGYLKITLSDSYSNKNITGALTKLIPFGFNANNGIWGNGSNYQITEAVGGVATDFTIGDIAWDATNSIYYIPIYHLSSNGNGLKVRVEYFGENAGQFVDNVGLSSVYIQAAPAPYNVRHYQNINDRLGIGTASPGAKLQIYSTANRDIFISGPGTQAENTWQAQHAFFTSAGQGVIVGKANVGNDTNRLHILYNSSNGDAEYLAYDTNNSNKVKLNTNGDSYLNGGNVGIGTTSPAVKLQVSGNASVGTIGTPKSDWWSAFNGIQIGDGTTLWGRASDTHLSSNYYAKDNSGTAQDAYINTSYANDFWLDNADGTLTYRNAASGTAGTTITWNTRLKILNNGNVGIGNTAPSNTFTVGANLTYSSSFNHDSLIENLMVTGDGSAPANLWLHKDDETIFDGNDLGNIKFSGHNGTDSVVAGRIWMEASEDWSGSTNSTRMSFSTVDGTTSTTGLVIEPDGAIQLPQYTAGILTSDASGNITVDTTTYSTFSGDYGDLTNPPSIPVSGTDFDPVGTDNSTDVTLAGSYDYLTLSGQEITLGQIDYSTDITNTPSIPASGTDFDPVGTDNSTDVTLVTTSHDYLSISGQAITLDAINLDDINGGSTAGILTTNTSGVISIDTNTYLTSYTESGNITTTDDATNAFFAVPFVSTTAGSGKAVYKDANNFYYNPSTNNLQVGLLDLSEYGTAASPAIRWSGDGDTGIFSGGSNTNVIGFSTQGAEKMRLDASGNLGINVTNPLYKLDVGGTIYVRGTSGTLIRAIGANNSDQTIIRISNGSQNDDGDYGFSIKYMGTRSGNLNSLSIFSDGQTAASQTEAITIAQNGIVGFTNDSPTATVDIGGTLKASGEVTFSNYGAGILTTNASGVLSVDTTTYSTFSGDYADLTNPPSIPVSGTDFDPAGTDNSTDVTLDTTSYDYLSITGQEITLGQIDYSTDITNTPTLGTAAATASTDYATAAQGSTADSALQPGDADLTPSWVPASDPSYLTSVAFSDLTTTPTTISGYGITDALQIGTTATTAMAGNTAVGDTNVQSDWNATTGDALILNKPTLFDGAYSSLTGLPTIPASGTDFDPVGTDNSTNVTLNTTKAGFLTISGQEITLEKVRLNEMAGGSTAGLLQTDANGNVTVDTNTYSTATGVANNADNYGGWHAGNGADTQLISSGDWVNFDGGVSISGAGTELNPYLIDLSGVSSYTAGAGLDLSSGSFSVEPDLRDGITHVGKDTDNYIQFDVDGNGHMDFYVNGVWSARLEADGDLHVKGDVIAFSNIFNP